MKSVMISIQPQWCELILSGKKTLEVRKTRPKLETPFKCYIYCTLAGSNELFRDTLKGDVAAWNRGNWAERKGHVIGEFICDLIFDFGVDYCIHDELPGCPYETWLTWDNAPDCFETKADIENATGLRLNEIDRYMGTSDCGFAWHISDLKIYDKPKKLKTFSNPCGEYERDDPRCGCCDYYHSMGEYPAECACDGMKPMLRPPQSWCYVEELR